MKGLTIMKKLNKNTTPRNSLSFFIYAKKLEQSNTLSSMSKHSIMLSQAETLFRKCRTYVKLGYSS